MARLGRCWSGLCTLLVVSLLLAPEQLAQNSSLLDQAERLADRGEVREARQALERWQSDFAASAPLEERARAWFLSGRLADEGEEAELHYLRVVIEGSSTAYADDALLRLAQYKYALGEHGRAIEYLARLRRDYPTSENGPTALLWVARAARAQGDSRRACEAADQGIREAAPGDTALELALRDEKASCEEVSRTYTVQVAAFQDEAAAQRLARQLLEEGYDAWVLVASGGDPLHRVRVGRDLVEMEAQGLIERLSQAGYSPFLVSQSGRSGGAR